jgi:hypothetical protein
LSYGIAGYTAVQKMPILLDLEPHLPLARTNAHKSLLALTSRFRAAHPAIPLHVIADSAFGSFTTIEQMRDLGAHVTFSMAPNHRPWLWEMLAWECPLDSGRTALVPILDGREHALASVFHVKSDTDKVIDIRTLTTGFSWTRPDIAEETVARIGQRRTSDTGIFEYETVWADGSETWQQARSFMDDDGKFNIAWLEKAEAEDVRDALHDLTQAQLEAICEANGWKVPSFCCLLHFSYGVCRNQGPNRA